MRFTILGASGFIGSHLVAHLKDQGEECIAPGRDDLAIFEEDLGHVIYSIGVTADFRERPLDTVSAHICHLLGILEKASFKSLLYLSSTRVYGGISDGSEDAVLRVSSQNPSDLYNLSKLMGESLCLSSKTPGVRIARLSNVYGHDPSSKNFLNTIIRDAVERKEVVLTTAYSSEKDFVGIDDVTALLPRIAISGKCKIYNVASGMNVSNAMLAEGLKRLTGCSVRVLHGAPEISFPKIGIDRIRDEFDFRPSNIMDALGNLVASYTKVGSL